MKGTLSHLGIQFRSRCLTWEFNPLLPELSQHFIEILTVRYIFETPGS